MENRQTPPPVVVTLAVAFSIYLLFWQSSARDVIYDYIPWLDHIIATGPIAAFSRPFAAYNPPYLYLLALVSPLHLWLSSLSLIKLVSLIGTIALAVATHGLLKQQDVFSPGRWAALILVLPVTVMNAAMIGQCDALYVAPAVVALSAAFRRDHATMLFWCGVSIAFKLQAVLLAPFIIALLINRRVPLHLWLIVPAVFIAALLPAWIAGWPAADLLGIYVGQANTFSMLSLNAPNIWFFIQFSSPGLASSMSGLALLAAVVTSAIYIFRFAKRMSEGTDMLVPAILSVLLTAGLLPYMHERYFFIADIFTMIYAIILATRRAWVIAVLVQTGSALATAGYVFWSAWTPWLVIAGSIPMMLATALAIVEVLANSGDPRSPILVGDVDLKAL